MNNILFIFTGSACLIFGRYFYLHIKPITYSVIYVYSWLETKINKYINVETKKHIVPYDTNYTITAYNAEKMLSHNFLFDMSRDINSIILISDKEKNTIVDKCVVSANNKINKKTVRDHVSTLKFLNMTISHKEDDEPFEISLNEPNEYNFYLNKNILDYHFFHYFLSTIHKKDIDHIDNFKYTLNIIDHMCNIIVLTEKDTIIMKDNSYVIRINEPKEKEEEEEEEENEKEKENEEEEKEKEK